MDKFQAMRRSLRVVESGTFVKAGGVDAAAKTHGHPADPVPGGPHLSVKSAEPHTRRVSVMPPKGAAYYDRASRLLGELDELEASVVASRSAPKGRLKIDLPQVRSASA